MPISDTRVVGKEAFLQHVRDYNALFAEGHIDVEFLTLVADERAVAGELACSAQYVGPGAPDGGVQVNWHATLVDTIENGRVITEHGYFDPTVFDQALQQFASDTTA